MDDGPSVLVDFMAAEYRLRRQALKEAQQVALWQRRELFAAERNLTDMAAEAQTRAERHAGLERALLARAEEIRSEIQNMRGVLQTTRGVGRAPPGRFADDLDRRLAALEVEQEIEAIHASIDARGTRDGEPAQRSGAQLFSDDA